MNEYNESILKIFGIAARTTNTRCSDDADEARGGGRPSVLQSAGSFVHWQDIRSPNYRHRCVRTAAAPEAQLGPSMICDVWMAESIQAFAKALCGLHGLKIQYIGATVFYFILYILHNLRIIYILPILMWYFFHSSLDSYQLWLDWNHKSNSLTGHSALVETGRSLFGHAKSYFQDLFLLRRFS